MSQVEVEDVLIEEAPPPRKKREFKLPRGTKLMLFVFILCALAFGVSRCIRGNPGDAASVSGVPVPSAQQAKRVGFGNEEYNARIEQYSEEKTARAEKAGATWVPPISAKPEPVIMEEEPVKKPEPAPVAKPRPMPKEKPAPTPPPRNPQAQQRMQAYLTRILTPPQQEAQSVIALNAPAPYVVKAQPAASAAESMPGYGSSNVPPLLKPGDILYAINRITLDSDAPGPSMVEVISGPYKGAKAMGSFVRSGKNLTLQFEGLVMPDGRTYSLKGFAISPDTDRTAISSSVDNHYIERYGGLIAASFLSGFGRAVGSSGTSSYSNLYGGGYSVPNYDINEQLWIAAGEVGTKMSNLFERNWDMPPTVILESGTDIGVLVISVGRDIPAPRQDQQQAAQPRQIRNPDRIRGIN